MVPKWKLNGTKMEMEPKQNRNGTKMEPTWNQTGKWNPNRTEIEQ